MWNKAGFAFPASETPAVPSHHQCYFCEHEEMLWLSLGTASDSDDKEPGAPDISGVSTSSLAREMGLELTFGTQ
jgi:hypothetical protein